MTKHTPDLWKRMNPQFQTDFLMRAHYLKWLGNIKEKSVLDACCGDGYVARMLERAGAKVFAFDKDPKMIAHARHAQDKQSNIEYKVADLLDVKDAYSEQRFDLAVLSGCLCFLDESALYGSLESVASLLSPQGRLLMSTLHTDAYFQGSKSKWMKFTSEPDPSLPTQQASLDFYAPNGEVAFTGGCYFHTSEQIRNAFQSAGLRVESEHAPLASAEDLQCFPEMWGDEVSIPYHLAMVGKK